MPRDIHEDERDAGDYCGGDGLTGPERLWLLRAAAYRDLAPACEAEQRQLADALPDAVGPVRRGHRPTTRQAEQLLVEWRQRQAGRRVARFERMPKTGRRDA